MHTVSRHEDRQSRNTHKTNGYLKPAEPDSLVALLLQFFRPETRFRLPTRGVFYDVIATDIGFQETDGTSPGDIRSSLLCIRK